VTSALRCCRPRRIRVARYQQFATLDLISAVAPRSWPARLVLESFPLFGFNLNDYDEMFAEKLDLLLQIRAELRSRGKAASAALNGQGVYPRRAADAAAGSGSPPAARRNRSRALARSACPGDCDHRRRTGALWPLPTSTAGGGSPAPASRPRNFWSGSMAMVPRRHVRSRRRCVFGPYAEVMSRNRPRAWLARPVARAGSDQGRGPPPGT